MIDGPGARRLVRQRALPVVAVLAAVAAAAGAGWAVAGPPTAPRVLAAPRCPQTLGDALPRTGPSSVDVVPWGPVTGRVCRYPTQGRRTPQEAPLAGSVVLDATASAQVAGLLHPLPRPVAGCTGPPVPAGEVAVVLLRYRPGATPTVRDVLPVAVWTAAGDDPAAPPCRVATNGTVTLAVPDAARRRLVEQVPSLGAVLRTS
ncbi:MAG: hypothetical protein ACKVZ6_01315 [Kineosporiaceae bacterium]